MNEFLTGMEPAGLADAPVPFKKPARLWLAWAPWYGRWGGWRLVLVTESLWYAESATGGPAGIRWVHDAREIDPAWWEEVQDRPLPDLQRLSAS